MYLSAEGTDDVYMMHSSKLPWWVWVIVGVAVAALLVCFIWCCLCSQKEKKEMVQEEEKEALATIDEKDDLDQPLIV